jgi:hypothetical protein
VKFTFVPEQSVRHPAFVPASQVSPVIFNPSPQVGRQYPWKNECPVKHKQEEGEEGDSPEQVKFVLMVLQFKEHPKREVPESQASVPS